MVLWLAVGTLGYLILQQWSVGQSFYFMVQAGVTLTLTLTITITITIT